MQDDARHVDLTGSSVRADRLAGCGQRERARTRRRCRRLLTDCEFLAGNGDGARTCQRVGLAATLYCTAPGPVPGEPAVIAIHEALLTALHSQPAGPLTVTVPFPPAAATVWLEADNVNGQGTVGTGPAAIASCEMVTT